MSEDSYWAFSLFAKSITVSYMLVESVHVIVRMLT